jgi:glycosyltransferase 2 family protein
VRSNYWRWLAWLLGLIGVGFALKFFTGFPWRVTFTALLDADPWLLGVACIVNLSTLAAKGWGWHLILKPVAPHSWRVAQEANLVGSAVNDLSVAVAGEAARVHLIAQRGGVPVGAAISSVVWTRLAEALALALFLVMAPSVLELDARLRIVQVGAGLALTVVLLLAWARGWAWLADQLPAPLASRVALLRTMGKGGRLLLPTLLALYNWGGQWATYHLVLRATHVPVSLAASFTALIAANLSGMFRPTPANVGITQAALVVGLLPFGVPPERAVAAGLALQGLQVIPVLFLGAVVTGWRLRQLEADLSTPVTH